MSTREHIDHFLGYPEPGDTRHSYATTPNRQDEEGRFAVVTTEWDAEGENPIESRTVWSSLARALVKRELRVADLGHHGLGPSRVEVTVVDLDDPGRGPLGWEDLA